jgi:rhodanese-related sulfurtransferase
MDTIGEPTDTAQPYFLDVRTNEEFAVGHIPDAVNIPIDELRHRMNELPKDRAIVVYCHAGQRGYVATRVLLQSGFNAANVGGGYRLYRMMH